MANYFPLIANTTSSQIQEIPVGSFLDLSQSGIANSGNITVNGLVSVTGNVAGTYLLGNGAFITGLPAGYSNADVADYLPTYTGNLVSLTGNIITTGNITASYVLPQSNATTDLGSNTLQWRSLYVSNNTIYIGGVSVGVSGNSLTVGNSTVVTEGTILTGNINTSGNITGGNLITSGTIIGGTANVTSLDAFSGGTGGSIKVKRGDGVTTVELDGSGTVTASANITAGGFSTTGNLTAAYLLGNGAFITGLPAGYANSDVANYLASGLLTSNIITTANVSAGNITTGIITGGAATVTSLDAFAGGTGGSINVKNSFGTPVIVLDGATGNVSTGNTDAINFVASANITATGNISAGNVSVTGVLNVTNDTSTFKDVNIQGQVLNNLTVQGNVNGGNLYISQDAVILGNLRVQGNTTEINVSNIFLTDKDIIVAANANATLSDLNGAGLQIGNISAGGNITFFYNSTSNTMALSHGANIANTLTVTGTVIGGNLQTSGTITGGAANVTSLDAFSGGTGGSIKVKRGDGVITVELDGSGTVTASSNVTAGGFSTTGNLTAAYLLGNGAFITGLPAGYSNAQVDSYLASNANVTILTTGNITTTGNVSGSYLLGNGSQLTGISAGAAIADDTTTDSNYYPVFATATSGSLTTATISSTKLTFNPSSGTLTAVDVNTSSDLALKENVDIIDSAMDLINSIKGVSFNWSDTKKKSYGVIAQDLEKTLPELVGESTRGKTVSYLPLIAILIQAVKEQQQQIQQLMKK
jgi:hypothetical protein